MSPVFDKITLVFDTFILVFERTSLSFYNFEPKLVEFQQSLDENQIQVLSFSNINFLKLDKFIEKVVILS